MRLQRHKMAVLDFELLTIIGRGAFGEVRIFREKATGHVHAMQKLKKSEMLRRGKVEHVKGERNILAEVDSAFIVKLYCSSVPKVQKKQDLGEISMLSSKDVNFVGYTYKNFDIVNDHHMPVIVDLKKKSNKPTRPSIKSFFDVTDSSKQPIQGSSLNMLCTQVEVSESPEQSPVRPSRPPPCQYRPYTDDKEGKFHM